MADLSTSEKVREYVARWAPRLIGKMATFVETSEGRRIEFATMSNEDALWVAEQLRQMELMGTMHKGKSNVQ